MDPLSVLPPELALRILSVLQVSDLANLQTLSKAWNSFLAFHEDPIYRAASGYLPTDCLSDLCIYKAENTVEHNYWSAITTWKKYCRKSHTLDKNLTSPRPYIRERAILSYGNHLVWRFRPDFERRWIVSTAHQGGLQVRDLDTSELLWSLDEDKVRAHAHLGYSKGYFVFDHYDKLSIWRSSSLANENQKSRRGKFINVAEIVTFRTMRGFHLDFPLLCVVSPDGLSTMWDLTDIPANPPEPIRLTQPTWTIDIQMGATGNLYQSPTSVVYSFGTEGFHIYDKFSGVRLGKFPPPSGSITRKNIFHIRHPNFSPQLARVLDQKDGSKDIAIVKLMPGPLEVLDEAIGPSVSLEHDEWGAGIIDGPLLVGISKGGRVMICSDWESMLKDPKRVADCFAIVEIDSDAGVNFELGGWLSVKCGRAIFEVIDRIYVLHLPKPGQMPITGEDQIPVHAIPSSSSSQLPVAVSFMCVTEDGLMATYSNISMTREFTTGRAQPRVSVKKQARIVSYIPRP